MPGCDPSEEAGLFFDFAGGEVRQQLVDTRRGGHWVVAARCDMIKNILVDGAACLGLAHQQLGAWEQSGVGWGAVEEVGDRVSPDSLQA